MSWLAVAAVAAVAETGARVATQGKAAVVDLMVAAAAVAATAVVAAAEAAVRTPQAAAAAVAEPGTLFSGLSCLQELLWL